MSNWSELPKELLELVADRLVFRPDLLNFSCVCTAWHSAAGSQRSDQFCHQPPLLMLPSDGHTMTCRFFSLSEDKLLRIHLPEIYQKICCGSTKGWLVMVDIPKSEIKLLNPFSRVEVQLPPLTRFSYPEKPRTAGFIHKVIISSNPTEGSDCVVMAIVSENRLLSFCRPGDECWTPLESPFLTTYNDIIYYKGLFYALEYEGRVVSYDLSGEPVVKISMENSTAEMFFEQSKYLVESKSGDLLIVFRTVECEEIVNLYAKKRRNRYRRRFHTTRFIILKLDIEADDWEGLGDLGDQILFLGQGESICILAHDFPNPKVKGNTIYFLDDNASEGFFSFKKDMGVFNYDEDGRIEPFFFYKRSRFLRLVWVTQNA